MKKVLLALSCLIGALGMTGCNTTEGLGRDVERAGEHMQDAAR